MTIREVFNNILNDIKVELLDEFDQNFERKAFFDDDWQAAKTPNRRGSLMQRTGKLRRSLRAQIQGMGVRFSSSMPYASIHNEGGKIKVTAAMKRYFWAMYYQAAGGITYSVQTRQAANTARNTRLGVEAEYWKALALKKVGSEVIIPKRQFLGTHPVVDRTVRQIINDNIKDYLDNII